MKLSLMNIISIDVDNNYKWKETLFLDSSIVSFDEKDFKKCKSKIKIKYSEKIDYSQSRNIDGKIYGCEKYIYDDEKKAKIYFENENICVIESNQEVNEWLIIMLEIMLLKNGKTFIHAGAVSNNKGDALLMPSWGGVGKTASISKLVNKGYKLLGDDLNILSDDGKIYGFPKKFVLYFYHKDLFPQVFEDKKIKCNSTLNKFYSKIIPSVKKIFRKIPGLLSFARKHNPQSIKVSPIEIFGNDNISYVAKVKQVVWIERENGKNEINNISIENIISKSISVTINEIFNENLNAVLIMCGMKIINYDEIFEKIISIYKASLEKASCKILFVDSKKKVECVADEIIKNIEI